MIKQMTTRFRRHKKYGLGGLLVICALIIAGAAFLMLREGRQLSPTEKSVYRTDAKICYVHLNHLKCRDKQGNSPVRYDLPPMKDKSPVDYLFASKDRSAFVAVSDDEKGLPRLTLLDSALHITKEVGLPQGLQVVNVAFSNDSKSLLIEMGRPPVTESFSPVTIKGQIYRYTIAKGTLAQLTFERDGSAALPYELADGRIAFTRYAATAPFQAQGIYVMEHDGKQTRKLTTPVEHVNTHYSYDAPSDTLFLFGSTASNHGNKEVMWHGTLADFEAGKQKEMNNEQSGGMSPLVFKLSSEQVLFDGGTEASIRNLKTGKVERRFALEGPVTGVLLTDRFTKSAQQQESKYEHITGLAKTPADFQAFIKKEFDLQEAACSETAKGFPDVKLRMEVLQVVGDSYVKTGETCITAAERIYIKAHGTWKAETKSE